MSQQIQRRLELLDTKSRRLRIKGSRSGGVNSEINVTPLVDVVLVLLIIFMLVLPKLSIIVELPRELHPDTVKEMKDALNITITKEAMIALGDSKIDQKGFPAMLEKEMRKNPFRKVLLSADKSLQFHTIRSLLNDLRDGGVTEVDLMGKRIVEEE